MEKEKQVLVFKNEYWLSEIGYLFFKYQVGYEVYDYSTESKLVEQGVDLMVLNNQNIPTYVMCLGNTLPFDKLFIPVMEDDKESRMMSSISDFVMFYDINQKGISIIDLPLLQEKINYNLVKGPWKEKKLVTKGNLVGIQVSKDDEIIKDSLNTYELKQNLYDKCNSIIKWKLEKKLIHEPKVLEISR